MSIVAGRPPSTMSEVDYEKIARLEVELGIVGQDDQPKRITVKDDWDGAIDICPECVGEVCSAGYCPRCDWNAVVGQP